MGMMQVMARRRVDWTRVGIAVLAVVAVASIVLGLTLARTGDDAAPKITDPAVTAVFPRQNDLVLAQSTIGIDLAAGYRGVLFVDGEELPTSDLTPADPAVGSQPAITRDAVFDPAQNTVVFTPREGATIERFEAGEHNVTAVFWRMDESRARARSYTWRFKVS
jgi:hypothetical protein